MIRAYLFDIDGTLLLTGGSGSRAIDAVFLRRYGVRDAMREVSAGGKTDDIILREIFHARLGRRPQESELAEVLAEYLPALCEELAVDTGFRLMPHVETVLTAIAERARLGIATGNVRAAATAKLERAGLAQRFAFGGYGCDSADRAELVRVATDRALEHVPGLRREEIVVVGDTVRDIEAARAVGLRVVAIATGRPSIDELRRARPDACFADLRPLVAWHDDQVRKIA